MKQIILIDDDPISNFLSELLIGSISKEIQIKCFTNPLEALAKLKELQVDEKTIVLLDLNMPQMSGWEFIDSFIKMGGKCQFIILTSSVNIIEKEHAATIPMVTHFLTKPLTKENVMEFIISP